jgi:hypothetical protein
MSLLLLLLPALKCTTTVFLQDTVLRPRSAC